jgi:hypothetical protein
MTNPSSVSRQRYFSENLLAWTALRHFLPTRLVHELASAMVQWFNVSAVGRSVSIAFSQGI